MKTQTAKPKPRNLAQIKRDRGYRWADRDPVLDEICRMITDSGLSTMEISRRTAAASKSVMRVSDFTIARWLNGTVRRPQNLTVTWVAYALGYTRRWIKLQ